MTGGNAFAGAAGAFQAGVSESAAALGGTFSGAVLAFGALGGGFGLSGAALASGALGGGSSAWRAGGGSAGGTLSRAPPGGPNDGTGVITAERFSSENEPCDDEPNAGTAGTPRAGGGTAPGGRNVAVADVPGPSSLSVGSGERARATGTTGSRRAVVAAG
jgi:hypothetical protein